MVEAREEKERDFEDSGGGEERGRCHKTFMPLKKGGGGGRRHQQPSVCAPGIARSAPDTTVSLFPLSLSVAAYSRPLPEVLERNLPYEKVRKGYSAFDRTDNRKEDQICSIQMFYLCTSLDAAIIGWGKCFQCYSPASRGFGGGNFVYRRRTARAAPKAMCKHAGRDTNINKDLSPISFFPFSPVVGRTSPDLFM